MGEAKYKVVQGEEGLKSEELVETSSEKTATEKTAPKRIDNLNRSNATDRVKEQNRTGKERQQKKGDRMLVKSKIPMLIRAAAALTLIEGEWDLQEVVGGPAGSVALA